MHLFFVFAGPEKDCNNTIEICLVELLFIILHLFCVTFESEETWLGFQIYFVYLNTFFASLLPLALLLFFNISTAVQLIKMSRMETRALAASAR